MTVDRTSQVCGAVLALVLAAGALLGCAQRDEVIAIAPAGEGGAAGHAPEGGGGQGPAVTFTAEAPQSLPCGAARGVATGAVDDAGGDDAVAIGDCLAFFAGTDGPALAPAASIASLSGTALALAPLDGAPLDLMVGGTSLALRSGHGDGSFTAWEQHPLPAAATGVRAGDLFGSAELDVVATAGDRLLLWPGHGSAGLGAPIEVGVGPALGHALADVEGDGDLDVVTSGDGLHVVLNAGDGSFSAPHAIAGSAHAARVAAGDLDADACVDLVTVDGVTGHPAPEGTSLRLFLGDCTGGFSVRGVGEVGGATDVGLADLDGVGRREVWVTAASRLWIFGDDGAGGLTRRAALSVADARRAAAADLDGDGRQELVVATAGGLVVVRRAR